MLIADGRALSRDELSEAGRILYLTDPYIYPAAFGSAENAAEAFVRLADVRDGMFAREHLLAAVEDGVVAGVLAAYERSVWQRGTLAALFAEMGKPLPPHAQEAEDGYFLPAAAGERGCLYILCVSVAPAFRGRGVASALLRAALARSSREAVLECLADNPGALHLYEKFGFRPVARYDGFACAGEAAPPVVKLHRGGGSPV